MNMFRSTGAGKRLIRLVEAFNKDGFEIARVVTYHGKTGVAAVSRSAVNYDTGRAKKAYYLEGNAYEAGYLMGSLAAEEVERMAMDFADRVVFSFIGCKSLEKIKLVQEALIRIIYKLSKKAYQSLQPEIQDEIQGLYDGCQSRSSNSRVDMEHLIALNIGIDTICSMLYPGILLKREMSDIQPEDFHVPLMCNAFTVSGKSAGGGCYFARDFMFPTADVFQDTAAMILYRPENAGGKTEIPFVSISAPGIIGSISAMNLEGVALGVNMSPGANCDPGHVGTNSLLLVKMCAQHCGSAEAAVDLMTDTPRGVSWNYIIADGKNERSCVAEAGTSGPAPDFTQIPPEAYRALLPDREFIDAHSSGPYRNGIMVRWTTGIRWSTWTSITACGTGIVKETIPAM